MPGGMWSADPLLTEKPGILWAKSNKSVRITQTFCQGSHSFKTKARQRPTSNLVQHKLSIVKALNPVEWISGQVIPVCLAQLLPVEKNLQLCVTYEVCGCQKQWTGIFVLTLTPAQLLSFLGDTVAQGSIGLLWNSTNCTSFHLQRQERSYNLGRGRSGKKNQQNWEGNEYRGQCFKCMGLTVLPKGKPAGLLRSWLKSLHQW